jgi:hypothetical protein
VKFVAKALREAFEEDVQRGVGELYTQIWQTYGVNAGERFKAHIWWGWELRLPSKHVSWCKCPLHSLDKPETT